jgi:hypothetical protein
MLDGARGAGGSAPIEGGYDEGYAGGGFGSDESRTSGTAAPARGRTPINDLDDDIPF